MSLSIDAVGERAVVPIRRGAGLSFMGKINEQRVWASEILRHWDFCRAWFFDECVGSFHSLLENWHALCLQVGFIDCHITCNEQETAKSSSKS